MNATHDALFALLFTFEVPLSFYVLHIAYDGYFGRNFRIKWRRNLIFGLLWLAIGITMFVCYPDT